MGFGRTISEGSRKEPRRPAATLTISGSPSSAGDGLASNRNEWLASHAEAQKTGKPKRPGEVKFCEGSLSLDGLAPCILDGLFLGYDREDRQAVEPADIKASVWARSGFKEWLEIYIGLAKHARCRFVSRERPIAHFTERFARVGAPFIGVGSGFSFFACVTAASHAHVVLRAKALGDRFCGATVYCAHALKLNMTCAILHQFC
jgi:hypothetical protein